MILSGRKKINKLIIRLQSHGCIHKRMYDIVLIKKKTRARGKYITKIGYFIPQKSERRLNIDGGKMAY